MADKAPTAKKGKKGKVKPWQYVVGGGLVAMAYYLYHQHQANASAATQAGTSSAIDPATGQPWATELAAAQQAAGSGGTPAPTTTDLSSQISDLQSQLSDLTSSLALTGSVSSGGSSDTGFLSPGTVSPAPSPAAPGSGNTAVATWKALMIAYLTRTTKLTATQAQNAVDAYLKGIPQVNVNAAKGLQAGISGPVGAPPVRNGTMLPVTVAKSVTHGVAAALAIVTRSVPTPVMPVAKGPVATPVKKKKPNPKGLPRPATVASGGYQRPAAL